MSSSPYKRQNRYSAVTIITRPVLKALIRNYDSLLGVCLIDKHDAAFPVMKLAVYRSFSWDDTPQGFEWWRNKLARGDWYQDDKSIFACILLFGKANLYTDVMFDDDLTAISRMKSLLGKKYDE